jgi:hypothetical protein
LGHGVGKMCKTNDGDVVVLRKGIEGGCLHFHGCNMPGVGIVYGRLGLPVGGVSGPAFAGGQG